MPPWRFCVRGVDLADVDLVTISTLAKATGDTFAHDLAQRLLAAMKMRKN